MEDTEIASGISNTSEPCSAIFDNDSFNAHSERGQSTSTVPSLQITPAPLGSLPSGHCSASSRSKTAEAAVEQVQRDLDKAWRDTPAWQTWYKGIIYKCSRAPRCHWDDPEQARKYGIEVEADDDTSTISEKIAWSFFKQIWVEQALNERSKAGEGRLTIPLSELELYVIDQWCRDKLGEMFGSTRWRE